MIAPRTAFVAGATGYTGRAVVAALRASGWVVFAHARRDSPRLQELRPVFERHGAQVDTTEWSADALSDRLRVIRPDVVFALLGITRAGARRERQRTGREPSYETVDFGLTALLVDACRVASLRPRFVYLSALGTAASARGAYLRWRWRAEEYVRGSGLPYTIARPSFITGPDRDEPRPAERIGARAAVAALAVLRGLGGATLARRYGPRTNDELAAALVRLATDPTAEDKVIESESL